MFVTTFLAIILNSYAESKELYFDKSFNFNYEYKHSSFWNEIPNIYICDDADIGIDALKIAINFWEEKLYLTSLKKQKIDCSDLTLSKGIYIINNKGLDQVNFFGETINYVYPENSSHIYRSEVKINNKNNIHNHPEVLIHELGHALGIEHHDSNQSVMYETHFSHFSTF